MSQPTINPPLMEEIEEWNLAFVESGEYVLAQAETAVEAGEVHDETYDEAHAAAHDEGHDGHEVDAYIMPYEVPHIAMILQSIFDPNYVVHGGDRQHPAEAIKVGGRDLIFINPLFSIFFALIIFTLFRRAAKKRELRQPGRFQVLIEMLAGGLYNFLHGIVGQVGKPHIPFLGSLFLFIWFNNLAVLFPGMKSPTSSFKMTIGLAIVVFLYVRYHNIKALGIRGYLHHLAGSPNDVVTWCLAPLMIVLEIVGEFIKPLSLALRLYGNIFGEDKLLAVFLGLGMLIAAAMLGTPTPAVGVPLHLPFFFLVLLLSTIQALVFTLLSAIYLIMMMPHEHEHEHGEHGESADGEVHEAVHSGV